MVTISRSRFSAGIAVIVILVIMFIFSCSSPNLQAQTNVFFSPADKFSIPAYNGTISFAVNGSYSKAMYENDSWTFMNLSLNGSLPIENLEFSAQNCNVTIFSYQALNTTTFNILLLSYVVEGQGKQILNLDLGSQGGSSGSAQWSVIFGNTIFAEEGDGWNLLNNETLIVTGATGNVTIAHYDFLSSFGNNSNLPFYQQHSVAIIAAIGVAITITITVVIKVRTREHSGE